MPTDQFLRNHAVGVFLPHKAVHLVSVDVWGLRARASLKMVSHTRGRRELRLAEGTHDFGYEMDARLQVL